MYVKATIQNDAMAKCIKIVIEPDTDMPSEVTKLRLFKNGVLYKEWAIATAEDFNISLDDYNTRNGYYYEYELRAASDTEILETVKVATTCSFDGLLISDDTGIWVSSFGTSESEYKCTFKKNANVVYVKTLRGKFPHAFVNAEDNYYTGSVTALFVSLDDKGCPSFDDANVYRQTFIDFLCNGQTKLFKTDDGRIMKIAIDAGIQEDTNKLSKLSTVTFNWTQVGEVDA